MPLLPPARREWTGVEPVKLATRGTTAITWSPKNWSAFSDDQKLTAWTFTSMSLEFGRGVALITDHGELLDRYAFLALPGTVVTEPDRNLAAKIRLANYNILKDINLRLLQEEEALKWITMFEATRTGADKSAEWTGILDKISHVPLRLRLDQESSSPQSNSDK